MYHGHRGRRAKKEFLSHCVGPGLGSVPKCHCETERGVQITDAAIAEPTVALHLSRRGQFLGLLWLGFSWLWLSARKTKPTP